MAVTARSKQVVARYGLVIGLALLLVAALAFAGAWSTYANPPTERVTEETNRQQISTRVQTSAVVTNNTTLYREGEVLEDMPVYLFAATPDLRLRVITSVPSGQRVSVTQRLVLRMRATANQATFWESTRSLAATQQRTGTGRVVTTTTVNMSAIKARISEAREAIGGVGSLETTVALEVGYETDAYAGNLSASAPLVVTSSAYWIDGSLAESRTHSETTVRRVTRRPDMTTVYGYAGVGALAFLLGIGLIGAYVRGFDLESIQVQLTRARYEEWISNGELPTRSAKTYVRVDSLEDLVDIAIDSNKRVIYDDGYDAYGVIDADLVYYYASGERAFDEWLDV